MKTMFLCLAALFCFTVLEPRAFAQVDGGQAAVSAPADGGTASFDQLDPDKDIGSVVTALGAAVKSKNWRVLGALLIMLLTWATRKWIAPHVKFLGTDRGGAILALSFGLLASVAHLLASGGAFGWSMLVDGLVAGFMAAGGWGVAKKIVAPSDVKKAA